MKKLSWYLMQFTDLIRFFCIIVVLIIPLGCSTKHKTKEADLDAEQTHKSAVLPGEKSVKTLQDLDWSLKNDYILAVSAMKSGQLIVAEKLLEPIREKDPLYPDTYINLGIIYYRTDRTEQAMETFLKATKLGGGNVVVYNYLGILYRRQGDFEKAKTAYEKAIELDANYPMALRNLGILFDLYIMDKEKALKFYEKYQISVNGKDEDTKKWIIDLKRRLDTD